MPDDQEWILESSEALGEDAPTTPIESLELLARAGNWLCGWSIKPADEQVSAIFPRLCADALRSHFHYTADIPSVPLTAPKVHSIKAATSRRRNHMAAQIETVVLHKVNKQAKARIRKIGRQEQHSVDTAVRDWKKKWMSNQQGEHKADTKHHVLTVQVGPCGLQPCLKRIRSLLAGFPHLPAVIHFQDIKFTQRRVKTVKKQISDLCPDYTMFSDIRAARRKRHYNMGVLSLVRNDLAFSCTKVDIGTFIDQADCKIPSSAIVEHCSGRVLCLAMKPPGAVGTIWHINVYQHTSSALAAYRAAVWEACSSIIHQACEQGAAVILAGDLNATTHDSQRTPSSPASKADKTLCEFISFHHCTADGCIHTDYSWTDPKGKRAADLDHIIAFPSSLHHSARRLLNKLDPGLNHHAVVVSFDSHVLGAIAHIEPDPGFHQPRLKTLDYQAHLPFLIPAVKQAASVVGHYDARDDDAVILEALLQKSKEAFGSISGYTKLPEKKGPRWLKGHQATNRELEALHMLRRNIPHCVGEAMAKWTLPTFQHRCHASIARKCLPEAMPSLGDSHSAEYWQALTSTIHKAIRERRSRLKLEIDHDQRQQLQLALKRIRNDFGKRRRTFRQALMRDAPSAALWGVMSSHPSQLLLHNWTAQRVRTLIPASILEGSILVDSPTGDVSLTCMSHNILASVIKHLPPGSARVLIPAKATLVADPRNKVSGIEHYFGMNAAGMLPKCRLHQHVAKRDIVCLSHGKTDNRELIWYCNHCQAECTIAAPPLQTAKTFLGAAVFTSYNAFPANFHSRLQSSILQEDLDYMISRLPLRKAPGPDGVPNELLRILPAEAHLIIHHIINKALTTGVFPSSWKDTVVTLMTKKLPAELLSNQCLIALCNTVYKLFAIIVNSRLTTMMEEHGIIEPEQEGGRRRRGCLRQIQRAQFQFHDAKRRGKRMYALFIDTANAYNSLNHDVLWSILRGYGLPETDVLFLENIYSGNRFTVAGPFGQTAQIHTHAGVPQGDVTSPLLWNLAMNAMIRYLHGAGKGYKHESGVVTSALAYIDDCCLMADSAAGFRILVNRLNRFY